MFVRYVAMGFLAVLTGFAGCTAHHRGAQAPVPRPLGSDMPAYRAPVKPDRAIPGSVDIQEPQGELTLRDALALSLLHNPRLADVAWSVRISEARAVQAGLRPNPELELEVEEFGGIGARKEFESAETTIQLSQLIELGGKRGARKRAAGAETILANYDFEAERLAVLTETTLGFIDLLMAQERLSLSNDLYNLTQQTFDAVVERVKAGRVSPLEETRASIELANRKIDLVNARSTLTLARKQLSATWGSTGPSFDHASGDLDRVANIPPLKALESLIETNPAIARWAGEMELRLAELALERAERIFDLTLSAGIKQFAESDDHAYTMGVSLPIPIFDRNQGGSRAAHYGVAQAERRREAARIRTTLALHESYESLAAARTEALALKNDVVPAAEQAFEAARFGYRQGKFDFLNVLDAQRTFAETRARMLNAFTRYHRAVAIVESLVGTSLDSLLPAESTQLEEQS